MPNTKVQKINMKSFYLTGIGVGIKKKKKAKKIGVNIHTCIKRCTKVSVVFILAGFQATFQVIYLTGFSGNFYFLIFLCAISRF